MKTNRMKDKLRAGEPVFGVPPAAPDGAQRESLSGERASAGLNAARGIERKMRPCRDAKYRRQTDI